MPTSRASTRTVLVRRPGEWPARCFLVKFDADLSLTSVEEVRR